MRQIWKVGLLTSLLASAALAQPDVRALITPQDYPENALERNEQGTVFFHLTIGTDGRVKACQITKSSGYRDLDDATCRIMRQRARFEPAVDQNGHPAEFTHDDQVGWYFH